MWFYKSDLRRKDESEVSWSQYDDSERDKLEKAHKAGKQKVKLNASYSVDLANMYQYRNDDSSKQRLVKREEADEDGEEEEDVEASESKTRSKSKAKPKRAVKKPAEKAKPPKRKAVGKGSDAEDGGDDDAMKDEEDADAKPTKASKGKKAKKGVTKKNRAQIAKEAEAKKEDGEEEDGVVGDAEVEKAKSEPAVAAPPAAAPKRAASKLALASSSSSSSPAASGPALDKDVMSIVSGYTSAMGRLCDDQEPLSDKVKAFLSTTNLRPLQTLFANMLDAVAENFQGTEAAKKSVEALDVFFDGLGDTVKVHRERMVAVRARHSFLEAVRTKFAANPDVVAFAEGMHYHSLEHNFVSEEVSPGAGFSIDIQFCWPLKDSGDNASDSKKQSKGNKGGKASRKKKPKKKARKSSAGSDGEEEDGDDKSLTITNEEKEGWVYVSFAYGTSDHEQDGNYSYTIHLKDDGVKSVVQEVPEEPEESEFHPEHMAQFKTWTGCTLSNVDLMKLWVAASDGSPEGSFNVMENFDQQLLSKYFSGGAKKPAKKQKKGVRAKHDDDDEDGGDED